MRRKGSLELILEEGEDEDDSLKPNDECQAPEVEKDTEIQEDTVELSCSVCLEHFEAGETLAWSRKLKCQHAFHHNCLVPWLMKNDDCPMCRTTLIEDSDYEMKTCDEDGEEENEVGGVEIKNGLVSYVKNTTSYSLLCEDAKSKVSSSCGEVDEEMGNHSDQEEEEVGKEINTDQEERGRNTSRKRYISISTTHADEESNDEEC